MATAHRTLQTALAERERCHASAAQARDGHAAPAGPRPLQLDKVVAEAAMLARCAFLANPLDASSSAAVDALALALVPQARGESVQARVCADPAGAIGHAAAHVYLGSIGHGDAAFDRFLQSVLDAEPTGGSERLPNQTLEWHWLDQIRAGVAGSAPIDPDRLARTCAARPLDVLGCSTIDLYVFTHVVMYASDMGQRRASWPRDIDAMAAEAESALAAALDADNLDLAAELLWTWPMLGLAWSAAATFAFDLLCNAQDEHGFLPGPEFDAAVWLVLPENERAGYLQRTSYHATFVMGMLCAAALRPDRSPLRPLASAPAGERRAATSVAALPASSRTPRWIAAHAALDVASRAALEPFVLDVTLRRSAASRDLASIGRTLEATLSADWPEGPSMRQALSLLQRANAMAALATRTT